MTTKTKKPTALERRKARVAEVIAGRLSIDDLDIKELDLMDKALEEVCLRHAIEEAKHLQPHQYH